MEQWNSPETIASWIAIALGIVALLVISIILIARAYIKRSIEQKEREVNLALSHQAELIEAGLKTQEIERKRIAADIHDELIGCLNRALLTFHQDAQDQKVSQLLESGIQTARRISHDLSPPLLAQQNLSDAIFEILQPYKGKYAISFFKRVENESVLDEQTKIQLFRVFQELVTNADKHAKGTALEVIYRQTDKLLAMKFSDNGSGFDLSDYQKGLGMKNLEMRIGQVHGVHRIQSNTQGTSTLIAVPLNGTVGNHE